MHFSATLVTLSTAALLTIGVAAQSPKVTVKLYSMHLPAAGKRCADWIVDYDADKKMAMPRCLQWSKDASRENVCLDIVASFLSPVRQ